jgi:putative transposase
MLLRRLPGKIVVLWDGSSQHKGDLIRAVEHRYTDRLTLERLPPYAPMVNPVEFLWGWLKYGRLCNFGASDAHELNCKVVARLNVIPRNQKRLRTFFRASRLPLPRKLLS